ncbi:MAG: Xaa-Pro peptidase family protein [Desulfatiglandales bacterium]
MESISQRRKLTLYRKANSHMNTKLPGREEILDRIERLKTALAREHLDGALIVQKVDLYYFSGTDQDAHLWVPASGEPVLLLRKSLERAHADALLDNIIPIVSLRDLPDHLNTASGRPRRVGLELDVLPAALYLQYTSLLRDMEFVDASHIVRKLRMIKSEYEISRMRKAAVLADRLFEKIPGFIRESANETELAIRAEEFYRRNGHPGISRTRAFNMESIYGHIMAGPGGAEPSGTVGPTGGVGLGPWFSQGAGWTPIRPGEPIMVDYTACADGYLADQARVYSVGPLPEHMNRAHAVMVEVQDFVADAGRAGVPVRCLYEKALGIVKGAGLLDGFMGSPQPVPFLGHGVGLELDEWPVIMGQTELVLEEGMTVAIEPKVIFPGKGVVGVENTFAVGPHGMKRLNAFPDDLVVL